MSTTVGLRVASPRAHGRPPLERLTRVELRKMLDTRAGFRMAIGVLAITLAVVFATALTSNPHDHTLRHIFGNAVQPAAILLPVVGVLLVTAEWTHRTALTSFTLVPNRTRTIAAKLIAGALFSVVPLGAALVLSVVGTAIAGSSVPGTWTLPAEIPAQALLYLATSMIMGVAFGTAFLGSAPATVLYFALPIGLAALSSAIHDHAFFRWIDGSLSLDPLAHRVMSATEWLHALTTLALWMLLPLAVGTWRVTRSEIK
jgi:ABC-2 type transport system permease protein